MLAMSTERVFTVHAKPKSNLDRRDLHESYGVNYDPKPIATYDNYDEAADYVERNESPDNQDTYLIFMDGKRVTDSTIIA